MSAEPESLLSDALLAQLMAVGQVDVLVGLPTLNNAATVVDVARAVHVCFTRDFPRLRTVLINSDAGSTDGTPELIRDARFTEGDMLQTSHSLRTLHRVVTPYHGLPGKHTALRLLFTAAELTQARTLVVLDPSGPATTAPRVSELIAPVVSGHVGFLTPRYRRHPRDGALITQLVRPLVRALYGVGLDEPLGSEFACTGAFAAHCLDQSIWEQDAARVAIDLWLRTEAVARQLTIGQIWRPAAVPSGTTTLRQAVRQILLSLIVTLRAHESYWTAVTSTITLHTWGEDGRDAEAPVEWDHAALAEQARHDLLEIKPLLEQVLEPSLRLPLLDDLAAGGCPADDDLWVQIVYAFAIAGGRGTTAIDALADMFVPLYLWRAARFMSCTADEGADAVQRRLNALCDTFERLRPAFVSGWTAGAMRST